MITKIMFVVAALTQYALLDAANNGLRRNLKQIEDILPDIFNASFTLTQNSSNNSASSQTGDAISGNSVEVGNIEGIKGSQKGQLGLGISQEAQQNIAESTPGAASSGYIQKTDDILTMTFGLEQTEADGLATSGGGGSNSGNIATFGDISNSAVFLFQDSSKNIGGMHYGYGGYAGNIVNFGDVTDSILGIIQLANGNVAVQTFEEGDYLNVQDFVRGSKKGQKFDGII
eukprot:TRINITY_DN2284_c0_g1_i2.p2 TRINITY_DN2284_c0_g1~~TRINITY_DN2284_c0_g1_i2.p2  ORF type:complete len:230 (-),score=40.43 TRINITY_DN2284_c0_g1_i2:443-1132(-)